MPSILLAACHQVTIRRCSRSPLSCNAAACTTWLDYCSRAACFFLCFHTAQLETSSPSERRGEQTSKRPVLCFLRQASRSSGSETMAERKRGAAPNDLTTLQNWQLTTLLPTLLLFFPSSLPHIPALHHSTILVEPQPCADLLSSMMITRLATDGSA